MMSAPVGRSKCSQARSACGRTPRNCGRRRLLNVPRRGV